MFGVRCSVFGACWPGGEEELEAIFAGVAGAGDESGGAGDGAQGAAEAAHSGEVEIRERREQPQGVGALEGEEGGFIRDIGELGARHGVTAEPGEILAGI